MTSFRLQCSSLHSFLATRTNLNLHQIYWGRYPQGSMKVLRESQKISKRTSKREESASKSGGVVYRFGSFLLDQGERLLMHGEEHVSLTPKVFDILVVLVKSAGHLVTKERLLEEVWPETFVEEA